MSDWLPQLQLPRRAAAGYDIYYLVREGRCPVEAFVDKLKRGDVETRRKVVKALQKIPDKGLPQSVEKCKPLPPDLWELKPSSQARLFFIRRGRNLYFLSAYKKKDNRLDPEQVKRARRIRDEYLDSLQEGMQ